MPNKPNKYYIKDLFINILYILYIKFFSYK